MEQLPDDFDWAFYLCRHEDLIDAGFRTEEDAIGHFLSAGASEGRIYKNEEELHSPILLVVFQQIHSNMTIFHVSCH